MATTHYIDGRTGLGSDLYGGSIALPKATLDITKPGVTNSLNPVAGDTVIVKAGSGSYTGQTLYIVAGVKYQIEDAALDSPDDYPIIDGDRTTAYGVDGSLAPCAGATIKGFKIQKQATGGMVLGDASGTFSIEDLVLSHLIITDIWDGDYSPASPTGNGTGIGGGGTGSNVSVEKVRISDCYGDAMTLGGSGEWLIGHSEILNSGFLSAGEYQISDLAGDGIAYHGTCTGRVFDTLIEGAFNKGLSNRSSGLVIFDHNFVRDVARFGINVSGPTQVLNNLIVVVANTKHGVSWLPYGIAKEFIGSLPNSRIDVLCNMIQNESATAGSVSLHMGAGEDYTLNMMGNVFTGDSSVITYVAEGKRTTTGADGVVPSTGANPPAGGWYENYFDVDGAKAFEFHDGTYATNLANWEATVLFGAGPPNGQTNVAGGTISTPSQIVTPAQGRLSVGNTPIDMVQDLRRFNASTKLIVDMGGTARPEGENWDAGCFEYVAAPQITADRTETVIGSMTAPTAGQRMVIIPGETVECEALVDGLKDLWPMGVLDITWTWKNAAGTTVLTKQFSDQGLTVEFLGNSVSFIATAAVSAALVTGNKHTHEMTVTRMNGSVVRVLRGTILV